MLEHFTLSDYIWNSCDKKIKVFVSYYLYSHAKMQGKYFHLVERYAKIFCALNISTVWCIFSPLQKSTPKALKKMILCFEHNCLVELYTKRRFFAQNVAFVSIETYKREKNIKDNSSLRCYDLWFNWQMKIVNFLNVSIFNTKTDLAILTFIIIHDIKSIQFVPIYITFAHFHQSLGGDVTYEIRSMIIF